jgi:acetate kinase
MSLQGLGRVLVLNAGSSSLKFKLFDLAPALVSSVGGMIDRIGDTANSALIAKKTAQEGTTKFKDQASVLGSSSSSLHPSVPCRC